MDELMDGNGTKEKPQVNQLLGVLFGVDVLQIIVCNPHGYLIP